MELKIFEAKGATDQKITGSRDVYEMMRKEALADRECQWVLHLNIHLYMIEKELTGMGNLFCVHADPREIFKGAVLNNAHSIICVHNHPSGSLNPSAADKEVCRRLSKAGNLLGIELRDFIIISKNGHCSLFDLTKEEPLVCIKCGRELFEDYLVEENGLVFCPYCWEVYFGEKLDTWIPKLDHKRRD